MDQAWGLQCVVSQRHAQEVMAHTHAHARTHTVQWQVTTRPRHTQTIGLIKAESEDNAATIPVYFSSIIPLLGCLGREKAVWRGKTALIYNRGWPTIARISTMPEERMLNRALQLCSQDWRGKLGSQPIPHRIPNLRNLSRQG